MPAHIRKRRLTISLQIDFTAVEHHRQHGEIAHRTDQIHQRPFAENRSCFVKRFVADKVIVECKAVSQYNTVFDAQALTYLRLMDLKVALVINFGERMLKDGIHRVVNGL